MFNGFSDRETGPILVCTLYGRHTLMYVVPVISCHVILTTELACMTSYNPSPSGRRIDRVNNSSIVKRPFVDREADIK